MPGHPEEHDEAASLRERPSWERERANKPRAALAGGQTRAHTEMGLLRTQGHSVRAQGVRGSARCGLFELSLQEWLDVHQTDKRREGIPGRSNCAWEAMLSGRVLCDFEGLEAKPCLTE